MKNYRRSWVSGGCYFFTGALAERNSALLVAHIDLLRESFQKTRARHPFSIDAVVVLPDHLHYLWTLPEGDADYSYRWSRIKAGFAIARWQTAVGIIG